MKVETLLEGVLDSHLQWATAQAEAEGVDVSVVVNRALARERGRVEGRRVDERIALPGVGPGAHGRQRPPGYLTVDELAAVTGVDVAAIKVHTHGGRLRTNEPISRGRLTLWHPDEAFYAVLCDWLDGLGCWPDEEIGPAVECARTMPRHKGVTLLIGRDRKTVAIGDGNASAAIRLAGAARAVSLEAIDRYLRDRGLVLQSLRDEVA